MIRTVEGNPKAECWLQLPRESSENTVTIEQARTVSRGMKGKLEDIT